LTLGAEAAASAMPAGNSTAAAIREWKVRLLILLLLDIAALDEDKKNGP
jgi:hypothetical protein